MPEFMESKRKHKKYSLKTPGGKTVHFGDTRYQQYEDTTGRGLYTYLNHMNTKRRTSYRKRHGGIKLKSGKLAISDPEQPAYYSFRYLW